VQNNSNVSIFSRWLKQLLFTVNILTSMEGYFMVTGTVLNKDK